MKIGRWRFYAKRERDSYSHALGLTVSRGFGVHIGLSFWWWSLHVHARDPQIEAVLRREIERIEAQNPPR